MDQKLHLDSSKIIFITQALHHLEKSIYLKKKLFKNATILNIHKDKDKLHDLKKIFNEEFIEHVNSLDELKFKDCSKKEIFVFFSFSPTFSLINFIRLIKKNNRKVVLIQDNHQFSIHMGSVNSAVLQPDLIIAASDFEEKYLNKELFFPKQDILSVGWLFKKSHLVSSRASMKTFNKNILIVFSAPPEITLLSNETYDARRLLLLWLIKNYSDHKLHIKLHPHEDSKKFVEYINKYNILYNLQSSQSSIEKAISSADIVVCSSESQAALDVISTDINKELLIYFFSKNNFLKKHTSFSKYEFKDNHHNFKVGSIEFDERRKIKEQHLQLRKNAYEIIVGEFNRILKKQEDIESNIEILLWLYLHNKKNFILTFLRNNPSNRNNNLLNLLTNKTFNLHQLSNDFSKKRSIDPLCIIITRYFFKNQKKLNKNSLEILSSTFFSEHIFQFFFRDFIRLNNLVASKNISKTYDIKYDNLIKKIEFLYYLKFPAFKYFFCALNKIYAFKISILNKLIFFISDRMLRL